MSAQSLQVITLVFPNPEWSSSNQASNGDDFQRVNSSISFDYLTSFTLRTLSTTDADPGDDVTGLLYVPDLASTDPCANLTAPYVPANVTRQADLPDTDYDLIAIAPWIANCTQSYLASARQGPVRGFLFFIPGSGSGTPPDQDATVWDLGDDDNWKRQNHWPVYAIPGDSGTILMDASAQYSGNMTAVPYGHELTEYYDSRDYVRLFVDIDTAGSSSTLPSLWVFLLVVLGILLAVIGLTSLLMHWLQRRRRQALRRRVANGEVDLEALGIKRLTVPQEILDQMPLYTYGTGAPAPPRAANKETIPEENGDKLDSASSSRPTSPTPPPTTTVPRPTPALLRSTSYHPTPLQQPTCAICLDDFVPASPSTTTTTTTLTPQEGTIVRELPCHHIFHPECVDVFLRDSSSLCPMCKKSALPKGYCPRVVTNAMVRRERMVRRIRERVTVETPLQDEDMTDMSAAEGANGNSLAARMRRSSRRTFSGLSLLHASSSGGGGGGRRISSAPPAVPMITSRSRQMAEMMPPPPSSSSPPPLSSASNNNNNNNLPALARSNSATSAGAPPRQVQPPSTPGRREWARRRAEAMLGPRRAPLGDADEDEEEAAAAAARRASGWRKVWRGVFP